MISLPSSSRNRWVLVAAGAAAVVVAAALLSGQPASQQARTLDGFMDARAATLEVEGSFEMVSQDERTISGIRVHEGEAVDGERVLSLQVLQDGDRGFAARYLSDKRDEVLSLYTTTPAPYAAVPTQEIDCPDRFHPDMTPVSGERNVTVYSLYADADRQYGVCTRSDIAYRAWLVLGYCASSDEVYTISYFKPFEGNLTRPRPPVTLRCPS